MSDSPFSFLSSIGEVDTSTDYPIVPAGIYRARIDGAPEPKRNKRNSGSYLNIKWRIIDHEEHDGHILFSMLSIPVQPGSEDWKKQIEEKGGEKKLKEAQDTVVKMFFAWFEAVTGDDYGNPATRPAINLKALAGRTAMLTVIEDEYEGNRKNTVKKVSPDTEENSLLGTASANQRRSI